MHITQQDEDFVGAVFFLKSAYLLISRLQRIAVIEIIFDDPHFGMMISAR